MGNTKMGQRDGFSAFDVEKLNKMYDCVSPAPAPVAPPTTGGQEVDNNIVGSFVSGILTGLGFGDEPNA